MARKTREYTVSSTDRDNGKRFFITELDAVRADRWATRALFALAAAGIDLGAIEPSTGIAGIAMAGFSALGKLPPETLEPLLAEMMTCVTYITDLPNIPPQKILSGDTCQIEEVATFWKLRLAVFELHTGFSLAATPQN